MKILLAHNHYGAYAQGGEATVFNQERDLLRAYGNEVETFEKTNDDLKSRSFFYKFSLVSLGRAKDTYEETTNVIKLFRPAVLHVLNYKFVFTSSILLPRACPDLTSRIRSIPFWWTKYSRHQMMLNEIRKFHGES